MHEVHNHNLQKSVFHVLRFNKRRLCRFMLTLASVFEGGELNRLAPDPTRGFSLQPGASQQPAQWAAADCSCPKKGNKQREGGALALASAGSFSRLTQRERFDAPPTADSSTRPSFPADPPNHLSAQLPAPLQCITFPTAGCARI